MKQKTKDILMTISSLIFIIVSVTFIIYSISSAGSYYEEKMNITFSPICHNAGLDYSTGTNFCYSSNGSFTSTYEILIVNGNYTINAEPIINTRR